MKKVGVFHRRGIVSAANYADGLLVFGSYDNSIYAVHAEDGSLAWRIQTEGYVNGTPAIVDGQVISVGCDGSAGSSASGR